MKYGMKRNCWARMIAMVMLGISPSLGFLELPQKSGNRVPPNQEPPVATRMVQQPATPARSRTDGEATIPTSSQRAYYGVLNSFKLAIGSNWMATVRVLADNRHVAMGAIVHPDGWVITKASELPPESLTCRLYDGTRSSAELKVKNRDLDLALLKLDRSSLTCVEWSENECPRVGAWLATTDLKSSPMAIGVLSVRHCSIASVKAVLGIQLDAQENRPIVSMVLPGSGAAAAGFMADDVIVRIDDQDVSSRQAVLDLLGSKRAGDMVDVTVRRKDQEILLVGKLMDINSSLFDPTEMEVNGRISARSTGFKKVFQHDSVISPNQCGGPVVDLNGRVVGINIARAGRVSSFAIPTDVVLPAIQEMIDQASNGTVVLASGSDAARSVTIEEIVVHAKENAVKPAIK